MKSDIISVEGISKMYKLGEISTGTLSHDLTRWWGRLRGRADQFESVAEVNDRQKKSQSGYVWSLKDVEFSVKEGEVFGIIGKNGAGKSTLLKILSKITRPTKGLVKMDGRVASLLEVGTGFHPDLSGRENVFLNGAILGMRKHEIKSRFDEIVDFSGIERYIDTPVKRYSSGMYVRLAFAVAAHLQPEILIIDEVLAVGDAEFQKKCLGKMQDVSLRHGRTVLFVSHNVVAIKHLCSRGLLLDKGQVQRIGTVDQILESYQGPETDAENGVRGVYPDNELGYFTDWRLEGQTSSDAHSCYTREECSLVFTFRALTRLTKCELNFRILQNDGTSLLYVNSMDFFGSQFALEAGDHQLRIYFALPVSKGRYVIEAGVYADKWIDIWHTTTRLTVLDTFEGHARDSAAGILNIKTTFSITAV
jgi:ABC-type polysaccharide/polyol phosphate transport system ATPase subunit